jgi:hypothetical protein
MTARQRELDLSPAAFGELRRSHDAVSDPDALRTRMTEDGYLFLPGCLDRAEVLDARRVIVERLSQAGLLEPGTDTMEAVAAKNRGGRYFMPELADGNEPLHRVLYDGAMMAVFAWLLGGPVRHFDYTWMRAVSPGGGTAPHCDVVYMGRGTHELYTAWTPLGDIPRTIGGLIVLENSHKQTERLANIFARTWIRTAPTARTPKKCSPAKCIGSTGTGPARHGTARSATTRSPYGRNWADVG